MNWRTRGFISCFTGEQMRRERTADGSAAVPGPGQSEEKICVPVPQRRASGRTGAGEEGQSHCHGSVPALFLRGASSILEISSEEDFSRIEEICLKTFEKTREWSDRLREICISSGSIDAMCMVSYEYFHNPLFVHDAHFYCVSCPVSRREMVAVGDRTPLRLYHPAYGIYQ